MNDRKISKAVAWACSDPMAVIRHRFAILFPQVPFSSQALKNALVAECGQTMATVDGLLLSEVAELLGGLCKQREGQRVIDYVTLSQCAAIVKFSKKTLERWKIDDPEFPMPEVMAEKRGEADRWDWSNIRPYLIKKTGMDKLPEKFPSLSK